MNNVKKKKLTLFVDEETINNSKKLKFNISAMTEEMLRKAIKDKPEIIRKRYLKTMQIWVETTFTDGNIIRELLSERDAYIPEVQE